MTLVYYVKVILLREGYIGTCLLNLCKLLFIVSAFLLTIQSMNAMFKLENKFPSHKTSICSVYLQSPTRTYLTSCFTQTLNVSANRGAKGTLSTTKIIKIEVSICNVNIIDFTCIVEKEPGMHVNKK